MFLASATTSNVTTVTAATGNATSFTYDALVTAYYSLPYQYRQNAAWVVSDSAEKNLRLLKDGQNNPLWQPNMVEGNPPTMFGRPVYNSPDLPTAAANNISVLFGDFQRAYTVRRVQGFGVQRLNELYSANGQIGFRGFERVDGRVVLASVAIGLKHSAT